MAKIILIGANHAGTAAANCILDAGAQNELVIFDRNSNISYLGCGTALFVGRQIHDASKLFYSSKEALEGKGAKIHMETEVTDIDFSAKTVTAKTPGGETVNETYDKLILATGSLPIAPKIPGADLAGVHFVKLYQDGQAINDALDNPEIRRVAVVGAGYIGVEIAESIRRRGKEALLFEAEGTSLASYYDPEFSRKMDDNLREHDVELHFNERITAIEGDGRVQSVSTDKGSYAADMVVLSIGFKPNTQVADSHLDRFGNGAFLVNLHQRTSDPDVYAIGDCATVYNNALKKTDYIALATNAVRSGLVAANNILGNDIKSGGVQGSNGISIYGLNMVSTGLTVKAAKKAGMQVLCTDYEDLQKPAFMENQNEPVKLRIVYDKETRRILGAQMASRMDISMGIHLFSLAVAKDVTIEELSLLDLFFLPHFNQPYNYITMAALTAE